MKTDSLRFPSQLNDWGCGGKIFTDLQLDNYINEIYMDYELRHDSCTEIDLMGVLSDTHAIYHRRAKSSGETFYLISIHAAEYKIADQFDASGPLMAVRGVLGWIRMQCWETGLTH